jgi:A/G-specific adenine glycosylase
MSINLTELTPRQHPAPESIATLLIEWAGSGQLRAMPWRAMPGEARDPYAVWVSEIMLQQTQVATVIPYFERWMARFPTVADLAAASQDEVLKAWEGLGYYSRARNLHKAAKRIVQEHGSRLPGERTALIALPGIGRYTVGAILSIAFGQRAAVLDGNVKRILARLYDMEEEIGVASTETRLWHRAEALVEPIAPEQAGLLNEALMDLGAIVCAPQAPRCPICPLRAVCLAKTRGTQELRPVKAPRKALPHVDVTAAVLYRPDCPDQMLIAQRPPTGMLGGLWEFPGGKRHEGETLPECLRRELFEELGIEVEVGRRLVSIRHAYTHFRITLHAFECRLLAGIPQAIGVADWRWVTREELAAFPFPVTDQKIIRALS